MNPHHTEFSTKDGVFPFSANNNISQSKHNNKNNITILPATKKNPYKIFLVEDSPLIAKGHLYIIENAGFETALAINGQDAITKANHDFSLILMDIDLPDISGIEATKAIMLKLKDKKSPVIYALTANTDISEETYINAGFKGVIEKPLTADKLKKIVFS